MLLVDIVAFAKVGNTRSSSQFSFLSSEGRSDTNRNLVFGILSLMYL